MAYSIATRAQMVDQHRSRWIARCFRITRADNTTYRFTEWDVPIWIESEQFLPSDDGSGDPDSNRGGVDGAAQRREGGLKEHTTSIRGVLSSSSITQEDLIAGRFDGATVDELWVDARFPWLRFGEKNYVIESIDFDDEAQFEARLVSESAAKLRQKRGLIASRSCRHQLFDSLCVKPHTDGVTPSLTSAEWTIGHNVATYASVSAVTDAEYSFTAQLPSVNISSITASPSVTLSWLNVIGDLWSVTCSAAHGATSGQYFDATFSGVSGATSINGQTIAVLATGTNQFEINMANYPGTPSGGSIRSGVTTITTATDHGFGGTFASAFTTRIPIGVRGVSGSSPSILGRWTDARITSANTITLPIVTTTGGTGGTVSYEPEEDWFARGKAIWTGSTDDNYLVTSEIRTNTAAGTTHPITIDVELYLSPGKDIATSDSLSLVTGCRRRFGEDCRDKFDNVPNYGGFPNMPAASRMIETPYAF